MDGGNKNTDWMTTTIQRRLYFLNLHLLLYAGKFPGKYTQTIFENRDRAQHTT